MRQVLDFPISQVLWTLGNIPGTSISLEGLYVDNSIDRNDVIALQNDRLISVWSLQGEVDLTKTDLADSSIRVSITKQGRKYLPR